jgi:hypothetical protein
MKKARSKAGSKTRGPKPKDDDMLPEYDFTGGVRGKYASRFAKDTIMVVLDPDVAELFPDPKSVNNALRALGNIIHEQSQSVGRGSAAKSS